MGMAIRCLSHISFSGGLERPPVLPNPSEPLPPPSIGPGSAVPRDGMVIDRFVDAPPSVPEDQPVGQPWGISPPSPTLPLRTRTGRTARWSSIGGHSLR
jgi:hypothetical protein